MSTDKLLPLIRRVGGMSLVRASSQAMYRGAETAPFLGIGNDLLQKKKKEYIILKHNSITNITVGV